MCDNCDYGSNNLDCSTGKETLYCCQSDYEYEVLPNDVCANHKYMPDYNDNEILGYDCDDNVISEFRVLIYPFSAEIEKN